MNYEEYAKLKEELEAEFKKKMEALEMVWKMCQKSTGTAELKNNNRAYGHIAVAIRKVLETTTVDFSVDYIMDALKAHDIKVGRLVITNTLHRLARRGELEVVQKGKGRIASIYRKSTKGKLPNGV